MVGYGGGGGLWVVIGFWWSGCRVVLGFWWLLGCLRETERKIEK